MSDLYIITFSVLEFRNLFSQLTQNLSTHCNKNVMKMHAIDKKLFKNWNEMSIPYPTTEDDCLLLLRPYLTWEYKSNYFTYWCFRFRYQYFVRGNQRLSRTCIANHIPEFPYCGMFAPLRQNEHKICRFIHG